jgi:hypothetical protein
MICRDVKVELKIAANRLRKQRKAQLHRNSPRPFLPEKAKVIKKYSPPSVARRWIG